MPRWYGTFAVDHPLWRRWVAAEAADSDEARTIWHRRGLPVSSIFTEHAWTQTNWAGQTHAQRNGLSELTAQEEEQFHDNGHSPPHA